MKNVSEMAEAKKKKKKVTISEEDMSLILRKYSAPNIITLLQEVYQYVDEKTDEKIDWNELVKKTSTGITNACEYQMLWRHLAYQSSMEDDMKDEAEPLDDDSDLELELEAYPPVSSEASAEAAACAKVLLASGSQSNTGPLNNSTVEAPMTINIPNGQASRAHLDSPQSTYGQGTNITIPVSVQKQSLPAVTSAEGLEGNGAGGSSFPPRRKRKPWTEEEDMELIAAVQKCGERNWANMLKGDFKGDRTASQLSQRWSIIRKRQEKLNSGGAGSKLTSQLSEQQLANRAVSHALNMPVVDSLLAARSAGIPVSHALNTPVVDSLLASRSVAEAGTTQLRIPSSSAAVPSAAEEVSPAANTPVGNGPSQVSHQTSTQLQKTSSTAAKSRLPARKVLPAPVNSSLGPNPMIQAAAVAAGARIATPTTAASLIKAAHSKNAVHIRPGGVSMIKTPMPGASKPLASNQSGSRPNVHYIRTGLSTVSVTPSSDPNPSILQSGGSQQEHANDIEPAALKGPVPPPAKDITSDPPAEQLISAPSSSVALGGTVEGKNTDGVSAVNVGLLSKQETKSAEEIKEDGSLNMSELDNGGAVPNVDVSSESRNTENMEVDEHSKS